MTPRSWNYPTMTLQDVLHTLLKCGVSVASLRNVVEERRHVTGMFVRIIQDPARRKREPMSLPGRPMKIIGECREAQVPLNSSL